MKYNAMNRLVVFLISIVSVISCNPLDEFNQDPELGPLDHGFQASAAIGYCASLASSAFKGEPLPANVTFTKSNPGEYSSAGILYVNITGNTPLPFNNNIGDIIIAGLWDEQSGGVISILFADIDILSSQFKFYGIHTVPVIENKETGEIITVFAEQDIIIGEGSDTLLNLSLSKPKFSLELERLNSEQPEEVFAAVKQNVWHITMNQNNTPSDIYDDYYKVTGGGQIVEANSQSGGILYHAMIQTRFSYATCSRNPLSGTAFIQNVKAGSIIDLGGILLQFHDDCDGRSHVELATGKYVRSTGKDINLGWD